MFLLKARYDLDEGTSCDVAVFDTIEKAKALILEKFSNDFDGTVVELSEKVHQKVVQAFKNGDSFNINDDGTYVSTGNNTITVHVNGEEWYVYEIEEMLEGVWY